VGEYFKSVAIVAVKPRTGTKPHKAPAVFKDAVNLVVRQALINGQVFKGVFGLSHQA
jgi:hypothetical protein